MGYIQLRSLDGDAFNLSVCRCIFVDPQSFWLIVKLLLTTMVQNGFQEFAQIQNVQCQKFYQDIPLRSVISQKYKGGGMKSSLQCAKPETSLQKVLPVIRHVKFQVEICFSLMSNQNKNYLLAEDTLKKTLFFSVCVTSKQKLCKYRIYQNPCVWERKYTAVSQHSLCVCNWWLLHPSVLELAHLTHLFWALWHEMKHPISTNSVNIS